jgi:hypothetical protein
LVYILVAAIFGCGEIVMASEKRRHRRGYCPSEVLYVEWGNGEKSKIETARCSDVGPGGMCIFSSFELEPGALLKVSTPNVETPSMVATVRWVEKLDRNLFRSGLAFL